jgi:ribosome-interacting GTPase 1
MMPTNVPPVYYEIEKRYREAQSAEEKIVLIEEMIRVIPKHKGTEHLIGDLRSRLAKLRTAPQSNKGPGRHESTFRISKEGAGQVVIVGLPNVGKSALVAMLTHATPEVAAYPYTTWEPTPGMMMVQDIPVQLVDTPPLNPDHIEGEMIDLLHRADLIVLMVDLQSDPLGQAETAIALLEDHRIPLRARAAQGENGGPPTVPLLIVANKNDDESSDEDVQILRELLEGDWPLLGISVTTGRHIQAFQEAVVDKLDVIRVYAKPPGKPPDRSAPFIMKRGSTVADVAAKIHRAFLETFKSARIWGSGEFDGQVVSRDHVLQDGDVVELHVQS